MKEITMDQRFALLHESNQKLLMAVATLVEHIDLLTTRIMCLEDKDVFDESQTRGNSPH
jgi:hypothetical protein